MIQLEHIQHEWHERNEKPVSEYTHGSKFKAWWKCSVCSHEWQATISNRTARESKCPECRKSKARGNNNPLWNGYGEISGRQWHCIQREAGVHSFTLSIEYAWELFLAQERTCALTGKPLTMWGKKNGKFEGSAALDRLDITQGFVEGNVQWVHKELQHMKRSVHDHDFIRICEEVAAHQRKKKMAGMLPPSFSEWASHSASR